MVVGGASVRWRDAAATVVLCSVVAIPLIVLLISFIVLLGPVRIIGMLARALSTAAWVLLILMFLATLCVGGSLVGLVRRVGRYVRLFRALVVAGLAGVVARLNQNAEIFMLDVVMGAPCFQQNGKCA